MGPCGGRCGCGWMGKRMVFLLRRWNRRERGPPGRGGLVGFSLRRWNGGERGPARPGPHFLGRNGGKNPRGRRFLPRDPLLWWGCVGGGCTSFLVPGLRPPRPTPHGPPTGSGGREKWFVDGKRKRETERFLSAFSQRVPTHVPSPPSRWAGRYEPFTVRAAGQVSRKRYSLPPHNPTREGSPEGRTSSLWGSFPHFFPRNGAPAGQAKVPCRSNGDGNTPQPPPT